MTIQYDNTTNRITVVGSATDIPIVVNPKGTGALQAQVADSTATGGNARGANAVDWQTVRDTAAKVASGNQSVVAGGTGNVASGSVSMVYGGQNCTASATYAIAGGGGNTASGNYSGALSGYINSATGFFGLVVGGQSNSTTSGSAVTTQVGATTSGSTAVTLTGSNASIRVGQFITGTGIAGFTYVAAISGTSLTLSQNAASSQASTTLSFFTPHGVVVGGGNNQATGSYSFIGGGGDAGTAGNRNVASGDWSFVGGGLGNQATALGAVVVGGGINTSSANGGNTASGISSFIGGGVNNSASAAYTFVSNGASNTSNSLACAVIGGYRGISRSINGYTVFPASITPIANVSGVSQTALLVLARETTDATPTVLTSNTSAAGTTNQVILPNNSAYYFRGEAISGVTGGGNTKGWFIEGVIKRGANAASTALVGTPTVTSSYADAGASAWTIAVTADTTNGGLAITFTGQAGTTIRTVAQIRTTEMTF